MNKDTIAERYESTSNPAGRRRARRRIHWLCAQAVGEDVLDVGCSQGIASLLLGQEGRTVVGVDREAPALEDANRRLAEEKEVLRTRVKFIQADARDLPFPDASFDTVLLGEVLEHQVQPAPVLEEAARVLRPGGRLVATVPYGRDDFYDHKEPMYIGDLVDLIDRFFTVESVELIDRWLGLVATTRRERDADERLQLLRSALAAAETRLADRDVALEDAKARTIKERRELHDLRSKVETLSKSDPATQERAAQLEEEASERATQLQAAYARVAALERDLGTMRANVAAAESTLEALQRQATERDAEHEAQEAELQRARAEVAERSQEVAALRERHGILDRELADSRAEAAAARQRVEELEKDRAEQERQLAAASERRRQEQERQGELEAVVAALEERGSALVERLVAADAEAAAAPPRANGSGSGTNGADAAGPAGQPAVPAREAEEERPVDPPNAAALRESRAQIEELETRNAHLARELATAAHELAEAERALREAENAARARVPVAPPPAPRPKEIRAKPAAGAAEHQAALRLAERRVAEVVAAARADVQALRRQLEEATGERPRWDGRADTPVPAVEPPGDRPELRVAYVGDPWLRLPDGVRGDALAAGAAGTDEALEGVDLLLLDEQAGGAAPGQLTAARKAAEARKIPVLGRRDAERLAALDVFDLKAVNPVGYAHKAKRQFALAPTAASVEESVELLQWLDRWAKRGTLTAFDAAGRLADLLDDESELVDTDAVAGDRVAPAVRDCRAVLDYASFHTDVARRAAQIVRFAASGVPVVLGGGSDSKLDRALGKELAAALAQFTPQVVGDQAKREAASIVMRRAALRHHSSAGAWRRIAEATGLSRLAGPPVSILMATNRRRYLDLAIEQVAAQTYENRELVLVLHGDEFDQRLESDLEKRLPCPVTVIRAPASEPLGVALNRGVEASAGEVLTKMDDDDWYGAEHVEDLVLALEYSGADLAGKGAEFIYLGDLDVTVRRWSAASERPGKRVSGATLTLRKSDLVGLGGWRPVERAVDSRLQDDLEIAGAGFYRCHGHGFIANRHGRGHTWDVDVDYFLRSADAHWRGVSFEAAGMNPGPAALAALEPTAADAG